MVTDFIYDIREMPYYRIVEGAGLTALGIAGFQNPDTWALAMDPLGMVFNILPNVAHQALGVLFAVGGVSGVVEAVQDL